MKPSLNCIEIIKHFEGCARDAYYDSVHVPTIGWGTTMYKDGGKVKIGDAITQEEADDLLLWEIANKTKSVAAFVDKVQLTQNQFDALVSFAYNVGVGALEKSTLLKKVKSCPNNVTIRAEFLKWNKARDRKTGELKVLDGLTRRRAMEADLYFKGLV